MQDIPTVRRHWDTNGDSLAILMGTLIGPAVTILRG
jgi:hypothetical protein